MTEFTQAGIDRLRDIMNDGGEYWSRSLALDALDEIERLRNENHKLKVRLEACMKADEQGELSEYVDGSILDRVGEALNEVDPMTEFTTEWIAKAKEQMKHISPLPWKACSCSKCGMITGEKDLIAIATRGNWGDDYPIIKPVGGSIGGQYEVVMEQITYGHVPPETGNNNAQYIAEACTNYPEALDHIERLQKRIAELEMFEGLGDRWSKQYYRDTDKLKARVKELEQERRWIPVSDRKPELDKNSNEDGTINVLVYIKNYKRILEATYYPKMAVWNMPYGWGDETDNITHWTIAIPQPPQEEE